MSGYLLPQQWPLSQTQEQFPESSGDPVQPQVVDNNILEQPSAQSPLPYLPLTYYHPSLSNVSTQPLASGSSTQYWTTSPDDQQRPQSQELRPKREQVDSKMPTLQNHQEVFRYQLPTTITETCAMPAASDFVIKLYSLLEDESLSDVICWSPEGDFFAIRDVKKFTTKILPTKFRHSNFTSFVRQLNKYNFHKIRNTQWDDVFGENSWLFHHPEFHADGLDALENIKRKAPGSRKYGRSSSSFHPSANSVVQALLAQVEGIMQQQVELTLHMRKLEHDRASILHEIATLRSSLTQQGGLVQTVIQYFSRYERDGAF